MTEEQATSPKATEEERVTESRIRPRNLEEFIGQDKLKRQISLVLKAAKKRGEPLDHLLFYGPPGLGKTTLAQILAIEMGGDIRVSSGPVIDHKGVLGGLLTSLDRGDFLFIDEIHRMNRLVEEALYPAMEDFVFDSSTGKGNDSGMSIRIPLEHFTVVGATTKWGSLSSPLRDRFGATFRIDFYEPRELMQIVKRSASLLGIEIDDAGAETIAKRARGTPRIVNRLLRRVRDFSEVERNGKIDRKVADEALDFLGVDDLGLEELDRRYLAVLCTTYAGRPAGVTAVAASLQEDVNTLEEAVEPYLMRLGYIVRTPRGRQATNAAFLYLGVPSVKVENDSDPDVARSEKS